MIHKTAIVSKNVKIGKNVFIWMFTLIREGVEIGNNCIIGSNVYLDHNVKIGSNVKIQNNALIYFGTTIGNRVFIGPAVCFANDKYPRSTTMSGDLRTINDWKVGKIQVEEGASIGAGSIVVPGVIIGAYSMVGAGSVITSSVPEHALVVGNPGRIIGFVCKNGHKLEKTGKKQANSKYFCKICKDEYLIKNEPEK